ncbi:MAG: hypothetical protein K0S07_1545 [Chlamydiales bacterium]|nr:hypothetical protein [Chlamydiales bacterium]
MFKHAGQEVDIYQSSWGFKALLDDLSQIGKQNHEQFKICQREGRLSLATVKKSHWLLRLIECLIGKRKSRRMDRIAEVLESLLLKNSVHIKAKNPLNWSRARHSLLLLKGRFRKYPQATAAIDLCIEKISRKELECHQCSVKSVYKERGIAAARALKEGSLELSQSQLALFRQQKKELERQMDFLNRQNADAQQQLEEVEGYLQQGPQEAFPFSIISGATRYHSCYDHFIDKKGFFNAILRSKKGDVLVNTSFLEAMPYFKNTLRCLGQQVIEEKEGKHFLLFNFPSFSWKSVKFFKEYCQGLFLPSVLEGKEWLGLLKLAHFTNHQKLQDMLENSLLQRLPPESLIEWIDSKDDFFEQTQIAQKAAEKAASCYADWVEKGFFRAASKRALGRIIKLPRLSILGEKPLLDSLLTIAKQKGFSPEEAREWLNRPFMEENGTFLRAEERSGVEKTLFCHPISIARG